MHWMITCAGCGQTVRAYPQHLGKSILCPVCDHPLPATPPAPASPSLLRRAARRFGWRRLLLAGAVLGVFLVSVPVGVVSYMLRPKKFVPMRTGGPRPGQGAGAVTASVEGMPGQAGVGGPGGPGGPVGLGGRAGWRAPGGHGMAGLVPETGPRPPRAMIIVESNLPILPDVDHPLSFGREPALSVAGRISPCIAVTNDPRTKRLITCSREGVLSWYDQANLRLLGSCRLSQPLYQLIVAPTSGTLIGAAASPDTLYLGPMGDREYAVGDLHAYSLDALYKQPVGQTARPTRTLPLQAYISGLVLHPETERVYYVAESARTHVGEVDVARLTRVRTYLLRFGNTTALALAPDAPVLYALSAGRLIALDLDEWKETTSLLVGGAVQGLAAGRCGLVYLVERRPSLQLLVVDVPTGVAVARWQSELEGRTYLLSSPTAERVYLGTSAVLSGTIVAMDAPGSGSGGLTVTGSVASDATRLLRGPVFLSADGVYLITGYGLVYRAEKSG